jgi:hypothetical protein
LQKQRGVLLWAVFIVDELTLSFRSITMRGWGVALPILGVGSFILPLMNLQFKLLQLFGEEGQPIVGAILIVAGIGLLAASFMVQNPEQPHHHSEKPGENP